MVLSFKTNLSHISDIENGRRVATLRLIADTLKVPLDLLVQEG
jgi:hypothetical protein